MNITPTRVPVTYDAVWDTETTYQPRTIVLLVMGVTRTAYLSTQTTTGDNPATSPDMWVPLGGGAGGDSEHNSLGADSTAVGTNSTAGAAGTAVGDNSSAATAGTAVGLGANSTALAAIAIGRFATGSGNYGISIGDRSDSGTTESAIAIGRNALTAATLTVGIGASVLVEGSDATAIGALSSASATGAIAVGRSATASGSSSVAVGRAAAATSSLATALGFLATAQGLRSMAIGAGASTSVNDRCILKANEVQVDQSNGSGQTSLILRDSANVRWRIAVSTAGELVVSPA